MYTKKNLTILIITAVVLFLLGVDLGIYILQKRPTQAKIKTADSIMSKVITSVTAYGKVTNINGKNITLNHLKDSLLISVSDTVRVYSLAQKAVKFSDIKVGDSVNIVLEVLPTGQLQGSSIIIFP